MLKIIDCTFRDGGYYNNWDFPDDLVSAYLNAMSAANIDFVELGFRSFDTSTFKGATGYTTDKYLNSLVVPKNLKISVMINAAELISHSSGDAVTAVKHLFSEAGDSPVSMVRIACHLHEFEVALKAVEWLKGAGYMVGINLMQIADRTFEEMEKLAKLSSQYPVDVLYFADSMGSLNAPQTARIVDALKLGWGGELGIHAHDNMGRALSNTLMAVEKGVTWIDSTVTGMGRGPGNTQTEYVLLEFDGELSRRVNINPLLALIKKYFSKMKYDYGWGTNPYYYLAGKYAIHPTYIQEMLGDPRYGEADILAVIDHLRDVGGKKFRAESLEVGRQNFGGQHSGGWKPKNLISGREILILGSGPSVIAHKRAVEQYILDKRPFVIALNIQQTVQPNLINLRVACHPFRLIAEASAYSKLTQPVVLPASKLSEDVRQQLEGVNFFDFGNDIRANTFEVHESYAITPNSLVLGYALSIAIAGHASAIMLAGFDGYGPQDSRTSEVDHLLECYANSPQKLPIVSITPTQYKIGTRSVYSF